MLLVWTAAVPLRSVMPTMMGTSFIWAFALFLVCCTFASGAATGTAPQPPTSQVRALQALYASTGGAFWYNSTGWLGSSSPCTWYGVCCDKYYECNANGTTVAALGLGGNNLRGTLPNVWADIPDLAQIDVSANFLSGSISEVLASANNLMFTEFSANSLTGTIPDRLPPSLVTLVLSANFITGTIPSAIYSLNQLSYISFSQNQLVGTFPLPNRTTTLSEIDVSDNAMVGGLPSDWSKFPSLNGLSIQNNQFSGELDSSILGLELEDFYAGGNLLSGTIPTFPTIRILDLSQNMFSGSLPNISASAFGNSIATQLLFAENNLTGTLPEAYSTLQNLVRIDVSSNRLSGPIPPSWGNLVNLQDLILDDNLLSGTIPSGVAMLPHLSVLSLQNNALSGEIPAFIDIHNASATARPISSISLANNNLSGDMTVLTLSLLACGASSINIGGNRLVSGSLASGRDLRYVTSSEVISALLPNVFNLLGLSLSGCNISGPIPSDFSSALVTTDLFFIDLSDNPLIVGSIPEEWFDRATSIQSVDVRGTGMTENIDSVELAFSAAGRDPFYNGSFTCPTVSIRGAPQVLLLVDPFYYGYRGCSCFDGYEGRAPHCDVVKESRILVYTIVPIVIGSFVIGIFSVMWWRRRKLSHRRQITNEILEQYAGRDLRKPLNDTDSQHISGVLLTMNESCNQTVLSDGSSSGGMGLSGDWIIPYSDIEILETIAHGASGTVSLGIWKTIRVAVKQYYPGINMDFRDFFLEAGLHSRLRHPNIVQLLGVTVSPLCTVLEFLSRGSLFHILRSSSTSMEFPGRRVSIALNIARGMAFLHSKDILHRDLKSLNVLIDEHWVAKVADFGASRVQGLGTMTAGLGTVRWASPESYWSGRYTKKCDIYSYGIVLWEICTGGVPYDQYSHPNAIMEAVTHRNERPILPATLARWAVDLIQACWSADVDERPEFERIVKVLETHEADELLTADDAAVTDQLSSSAQSDVSRDL